MIKKILVLLTLSFVVVSCNSEDKIENKEALLKSYKILKNDQGNYYIEYEVKSNTDIEIVKDLENNVNNIYLRAGKVATKNEKAKALVLDDSQLKISFYENDKLGNSFYLEDDDSTIMSRGEDSIDYLESYSIENVDGRNYELKFKVREGIKVWYEYNEEIDAYEVHLKEGESNGLEFSKSYIRTSESLKINFVNYVKLYSAKGEEVDQYERVEKPKSVATGNTD